MLTEQDRERNKRTPLVAFRMPDREALEQLQTVALTSSTSVSEFIRSAIFEKIEKEQTTS